jgi:general secretion pathway protein E/type IV pilus assembly protein PilB
LAFAITTRVKVMADLDIAERRMPQDGRIELMVGGHPVDLRVSVLPTIFGESVVMRILDRSVVNLSLENVGMDQWTMDKFRKTIDRPNGIILVTGPTGSGKTTTLYSALLEIRGPDNKIITTEDPVEYQLDGINQIQVHPKIGLTFAASLRAILRHDPDVVLVGEIRDFETAENAIQASLTGHLVFSTLHTNDAAGAYTRMIDMGVEPFLVASTVEAVMAQRLIRRLCPSCKEAYQPSQSDLPPDFPWDHLAGQPVYRSVGCRACRGVGYAGRFGIYELLVTTESIRQMAHDRVSSWEIRRAALAEGMKPLRMDAWEKAIQGKTSIEEVVRLTKSDRV